MATDDNACRRASQAAAEVLAENCSDDDFRIQTLPREDMKDKSMQTLGLLDDGEPDCDAVIREGFSSQNCNQNPFVQRLVYCMLWNEPPDDDYQQPLIDVFGGDMDAALEQSWRLLNQNCDR